MTLTEVNEWKAVWGPGVVQIHTIELAAVLK